MREEREAEVESEEMLETVTTELSKWQRVMHPSAGGILVGAAGGGGHMAGGGPDP